MKLPMIAWGMLAVIVLVVPLLAVTPLLVKKKALLDYGALVPARNQLFHSKWIRNRHPTGAVILGNPDASSLIDLGSSFTVIRQMSIPPIDKPTPATLAYAPALSILVVVMCVTPAPEINHSVLKMLG
ncbi:MAG: hypothetical protein WA823_09595 [Candidatus Acidiferrales bacterium]